MQSNSSDQSSLPRDGRTREPTALAVLRAVVPRRPLFYGEAQRVAELQANRLLQLVGVQGPPVPDEVISELPRIRVITEIDLPTSGASQWISGRWWLVLAASDSATR